MRRVLAVAVNDLRLTLADRSAVAWTFVLPLVFVGFFGLVFGGGAGQDPRVTLTVVDADGGRLARFLLDTLASEQLALREIRPEQKETTEDKVRTLVIPAGFSRRVLAGEAVTLRLEKEPDTNVEAALVAEARIVAAIARLTGRLVEAASSDEPAGSVLGATPAADLVRFESSFAGRARVAPIGFQQSLPGNLVMFVLLVALTYGTSQLASERLGGQLRRLVTTPLSRGEIVAGKIGGRLAVAGAQVVVLVAIAWLAERLFGVPIGEDLGGALVVLLVYACAVAPLGVLYGAWFRDPEVGANVGVVSTLVMAALGGCWWPIEVVSRPLQLVALAFPTGWAMRALHGVLAFGDGLTGVVTPLLVLLGFALLFGAAAVRSLRVE